MFLWTGGQAAFSLLSMETAIRPLARLAALCLIALAAPAGASESPFATSERALGSRPAPIEGGSSRERAAWGMQVSTFDPYPAVVGTGIRWNATDWVALGGDFGYGDGRTAAFVKRPLSTYAGALSAHLSVPGWNLSPTAGLAHSWIWMKGRDELTGARISTMAWVSSLGLSWQGDSGLSVGAGVHLPLSGGAERVSALYGSAPEGGAWLRRLPYLSLGYFF
jgi:hypothetical protein